MKTNTVTEIEVQAVVTVAVSGKILLINGEPVDAKLTSLEILADARARVSEREESPLDSLLTTLRFRK
jgi:hypothetical protein